MRLTIALVFKLKDEYKLELQTPETMKLFGKINRQKKNGESVPTLEVVEVALV